MSHVKRVTVSIEVIQNSTELVLLAVSNNESSPTDMNCAHGIIHTARHLWSLAKILNQLTSPRNVSLILGLSF